jgi:hypothetical protein
MRWIRDLPRWFPIALGALFLLLAFLKFFTPNYLCAGPRPFGRINAIMLILELVCGYLLIRVPSVRRAVSGVMGAVFIGASIFLTRMHLQGYNVRGCDCFGPIELSYGWHLVVIAALVAACTIVFLHEESRLGDNARPWKTPRTPSPGSCE